MPQTKLSDSKPSPSGKQGETVYWFSSRIDWLRGRGERIRLIQMVDEASGRVFARFVRRNSTLENLAVLQEYLRQFGRPLQIRTSEASRFVTAAKKSHLPQKSLAPTQIARVLAELEIRWTSAPVVEFSVPESLQTAEKQLLRDIRQTNVRTLAQANKYLETAFLPNWNAALKPLPDAHRPISDMNQVAPILTVGEARKVIDGVKVRFRSKTYRILKAEQYPALAGAMIRVVKGANGSTSAVFQGVRFNLALVDRARSRKSVTSALRPAAPKRRPRTPTSWMKKFFLRRGPSLKEAIAQSNASHYVPGPRR